MTATLAEGASARLLEDGRRLHLSHGPIDIVMEATGSAGAVDAAYDRARKRFETVLEELVAELPLLRQPYAREMVLEGRIARRMKAAVAPFANRFVTPMAAVAGSVADEILDAVWTEDGLDKLYVNNGGDIAFRLAHGVEFTVGLLPMTGEDGYLAGTVSLRAEHGIGGVATSGWRGRSFSLGIADAVTVLAATAARADAAATVIASAVDITSPHIRRRPANELDPDCDLHSRPVVVEVGVLDAAARRGALDRGRELAAAAMARGDVLGVALALQGEIEVLGPGALPAIAQLP